MSTKKIELEQDEELIVTHKGSAYIFQIRIDNYHDLNIKKINAYTITTAQKKHWTKTLRHWTFLCVKLIKNKNNHHYGGNKIAIKNF